MAEPTPETITLPKSGLVLTWHGRWYHLGFGNGFDVCLGQSMDGVWVGWIGQIAGSSVRGLRDECVAWLDDQALKLRAALLPPTPGAIVVADTEATVETIERAICSNLDAETYMEQARAVLAALRKASR